MAIAGRLESSHFPYLPFHLSIGDRSAEVQALLDTGFDGDVALPSGFLTEGIAPDNYVTWALADGSEVLCAAFLGTARLGTFEPFLVLLTAVGDEALVGRGVIDRFGIVLDHGQRVIVES